MAKEVVQEVVEEVKKIDYSKEDLLNDLKPLLDAAKDWLLNNQEPVENYSFPPPPADFDPVEEALNDKIYTAKSIATKIFKEKCIHLDLARHQVNYKRIIDDCMTAAIALIESEDRILLYLRETFTPKPTEEN